MPRRAVLVAIVLGAVVVLHAAPASACNGAPCDAINAVCRLAGGYDCVG